MVTRKPLPTLQENRIGSFGDLWKLANEQNGQIPRFQKSIINSKNQNLFETEKKVPMVSREPYTKFERILTGSFGKLDLWKCCKIQESRHSKNSWNFSETMNHLFRHWLSRGSPTLNLKGIRLVVSEIFWKYCKKQQSRYSKNSSKIHKSIFFSKL